MATTTGRNIMCTKASPVTNAPDRIHLGEGLSEFQTRTRFETQFPPEPYTYF